MNAHRNRVLNDLYPTLTHSTASSGLQYGIRRLILTLDEYDDN